MISQSRYVNIVSGVGAAATVSTRQLILRLITQNSLVPAGTILTFEDEDDVGTMFGFSSEEFLRAEAYFSFISKSIKSPKSMSIARWVSIAVAPVITGDTATKSLASLQAVTAGTLTLTVDGTAVPLTAINLSTAATLTDVASLVATKIKASANPSLATNSTFTYNTNTQQFVFTGAAPGSGLITATATGLSTDISGLLGLSTSTAVATPGQNSVTPAQAMADIVEYDNNFGTFIFTNNNAPLSNELITSVAAWNHAKNNAYIYSFETSRDNANSLSPVIIGYSGCAMNIKPTTEDYVDQCVAEILAATDYDSVNATQNYMYYQFPNRGVSVTDNADADAMDALRANYIGQTQSAGQKLAFFQRGKLMGGPLAAVDMNIYANEMWFKDYLSSQFMSGFLSLPIIPADDEGRAILTALMQGGVDKAKDNGTISKGKSLTVLQQLYITQISGDVNAWRQVANIGYWYNIQFLQRTTIDGTTEYYAKYVLIYSKNDAIRSIEGSDVLI